MRPIDKIDSLIKNLKISGFLAWITWLFVHIFFLIGFRNRFIVLFQWMWAYFTYASYSRLITYPWKPWRPGLPDKQLNPFSGCSGKNQKSMYDNNNIVE